MPNKNLILSKNLFLCLKVKSIIRNLFKVPIVGKLLQGSSVADPNPDVFRPPGSGSVSQRYGSGSVYHQK
jgi:hypothetical protein